MSAKRGRPHVAPEQSKARRVYSVRLSPAEVSALKLAGGWPAVRAWLLSHSART